MYKELEKYKTGVKDEYNAGLGDLMNDLIEHKSKPFWKRKYYHKHLTELYLQMLNQVKLIRYW